MSCPITRPVRPLATKCVVHTSHRFLNQRDSTDITEQGHSEGFLSLELVVIVGSVVGEGWFEKKILERKEISVVGGFESPLERPLLVIPALPSPIIIMVVVAAYRSSSKLIPRMNGSLDGRHTAAAASVVCSNNDHHHPQGQQHPPTTITLVVLSPLFVAGWLAVQHHKQSVGCLWLGYFWHSQK